MVAIFVKNGIGSGVRISNTEVLTAWHVVARETSVEMSVKVVGLVFGSVRGYDSARDLALIAFEGGSGEIATLSTEVVLGSELAIVGYVSGISNTTPIATFGRLGVRWNIVPGDYAYGQTDAATTFGMSGGAVSNQEGAG